MLFQERQHTADVSLLIDTPAGVWDHLRMFDKTVQIMDSQCTDGYTRSEFQAVPQYMLPGMDLKDVY